MTNADRHIARIATGQLGAFSRTQANDAGLSDRQLRSRVQSGFLEQTGPNSFRAAGAPRSITADLRALLLDVGDPVWVTGPTAAALHGMEGFALRRPFHLLMQSHRNVRRNGVVIHRSATITPVDTSVTEGFRTTSPTRTLIELARTHAPDQLLRALESALENGQLNEDLLRRRLTALQSRGRYGIPALLGILDSRNIEQGTESWLERRYLELLRQQGLRAPSTQQVLTRAGDHLVRVDCRFAGTNVVVELLGYRFHRSRSDMNRDAARMNALLADGFSPYQFTYDQVVGQPDTVVLATGFALERARRAA